jgi:ABC-type metal ion transport system substrate-binding protein
MLNPESLDYFRDRLLARAQRVLQVFEANGLGRLKGIEELRGLTDVITNAKSLEALAMLAEPVHAVAHRLTDTLEQG